MSTSNKPDPSGSAAIVLARAYDVAHVRFRVPDLARIRGFLADFGLLECAAEATRLFARGFGPAPFLYAAEQGPPGFAGFGIQLSSEADLRCLAAHDDVAVSELGTPGGGRCVRLTDPDGFIVEAVFGQQRQAPLAATATAPWNESGVVRRLAQFRRVRTGPSQVLRLGHVVLYVSDYQRSLAWYRERFGFVISDEIHVQPGVPIGAFLRCDRGEIPCDHHSLFLLQRPDGPGFVHAAFEVVDLDDLMAGRDHLLARGHRPQWGVGRHVLGSQIFDYWLDPWGHEVEHWTDGDQLRASDGGGVGSLEQLLGVQWGMRMPPVAGS